MNHNEPLIKLNELPAGAQIAAFGHRSGAEAHERCPRSYYLNYEYLGTGIVPAPTALQLVVGSAVHHGLAEMLREQGIDRAVATALTYFTSTNTYAALSPDAQVEQEVLIHGLLYSFWLRAYPSLVASFDVICVETGAVEFVPIDLGCPNCRGLCCPREGENCSVCNNTGECMEYVAMQSRPDAILRHKQTHEVVGWSWKTIDDPTDLRRSQLHNDLQGFMEMHYGERILEKLRGAPVTDQEISDVISALLLNGKNSNPTALIQGIIGSLQELEARARAARDIPTEIDYIQTVFLVKGKRKRLPESETPQLAAFDYESEYEDAGDEQNYVYRQMSHLCYRYRNGEQTEAGDVELYKSGPNKGKPKVIEPSDPRLQAEAWAWKFYKPDNVSRSALNPKWLTSPIQPDQVREWIDRLNAEVVYPSTMGDARNVHPLDRVVVFDPPLYRNAQAARRHTEQQKRRFVQIAVDVAALAAGPQSMEAVDALFPQHLINCRMPWKCPYWDFCHTARESELDFATIPEGFELREPHHQLEREMRGGE